MAPKITQGIELKGQEQVAAGFDQIDKAADRAAASVNKVAGSGKANEALGGVGRAAKDATGGLSGLSDSSDQAGRSLGATSVELLRMGQVLRLLGRATRIPELSGLGRSIAIIGRIAAVAAPVILVAALAKLAQSATKATTEIADTAAEVKLTTDEFQQLAAAQAAVGGSADDAGKMVKGLNTVIKEGAERADRNAQTFKQLQDTITETRDRIELLSDGYRKIKQTATDALDRIADRAKKMRQETVTASRDFANALEKIAERRKDIEQGPPSEAERKRRELRDLDEQELKLQEQQAQKSSEHFAEQLKQQKEIQQVKKREREETAKLNREIEAEEKKQRDATDALAKARTEADRNATALDKLGVKYTDATGKLIKGKEAIFQIADAFSQVTDPAKQQEIEFDLIAAGIDRTLIPALRRGRQGYQDLIDEGKKLTTPVTKEQIKTADDFQIALGQLSTAVGDIVKQLGLAAAPEFTKFLQSLTKLIVENKTEIIDFAKQLGTILLPVFRELGNALELLIKFIGNFERGLTTIGALLDKILPKRDKLLTKPGAEKNAVPTPAEVLPTQGLTGVTGIGKGAQAAKQLQENADKAKLSVAALNQEVAKFHISDIIRPPTGDEFNNFVVLWNRAIDAMKQAADLFWQQVKDIWTTGTEAINGVINTIVETASGVWENIKQVFNDGIEAIKQFWNDGVQFLKDLWNSLPQVWEQIWQTVKDQFNGFVQFLKDQWNGFIQFFIDKVRTAIEWLQKLLGVQKAQGGKEAPAAKGAARGWYVRGAGTSTSDSIPAYLSNKEYVNRAAAVSKYGVGFFNALNQLRFPKNFVQGLAMGGIVSFNNGMRRRPLRLAGGGPVTGGTSAMRAINLTIGLDTFEGLMAPNNVADKLVRVATTRQMSSAGRKPTYYGRSR